MGADGEPRPRVRDDVVFRELDREWVVFDPVSRRLHQINVTAALPPGAGPRPPPRRPGGRGRPGKR